MHNVVIMTVTQLTERELKRPILAFAKATQMNPFIIGKIAYYQGGLTLDKYASKDKTEVKQGVIYKYKTGQINNDEFYQKLNKLLKRHTTEGLDEKTFWKCWNSMCTMTPKTVRKLKNLENLQKKEKFKIHVIADSDPSHFEHIQKQLKIHDIDLDITYTHSYEEQELDYYALKSTALKDAKTIYSSYNIIDLSNTSKLTTYTIQNNLPNKHLIFSNNNEYQTITLDNDMTKNNNVSSKITMDHKK